MLVHPKSYRIIRTRCNILPVILFLIMHPVNAVATDYTVAPHVPDYLDEHRSYFKSETVRAGNSPVWLIKNPDNQMSNAVLIVGEDELVVFDTGASHSHGRAILSEIRKISSKPNTTLIYSHHHGDHCTGAAALVDKNDVTSGKIKVISQGQLHARVRG